MSQDNLLKLVQARGVPVVKLERVDTELNRKRKYSSLETDSTQLGTLSNCYKFNILKPNEYTGLKHTDDDGDSGIDGCSSVRSSLQGTARGTSGDDSLSHEDGSVCDEGIFAPPKRYHWEPLDNGEYTVQKVVLHKYGDDGGHQFFIKWNGWGHEYNTWEPLKHLHCPDLLTDFFKTLVLDALKGRETVPHCPPYNSRAYKEVIKLWVNNVSNTRVLQSLRNNPKGRPIAVQKLMDMLAEALHCGNSARSAKIVDEIKAHCVVWKRYHERNNQKKKLKAWEENANAIGPGGITVENDVDLEVLPENFKFVNQCVMGEGVDPPQPALVGCECASCDRYQERCCPDLANADFAYNKSKLFRLDRGYAVYECNSLCKCGPDCCNRVVQKGRQVRLCIFRTNNGRGWGVKAMQFIRKGTFISTYIGEILTVEEAEKRSEVYEKDSLAYLFDLDYTYDDDCSYSVDATYVGNESHFINHSCDPNSYVVGVYYENLDPKMPLLALFAARNICRGEEITFNYNGQTDKADDDSPSSPRSVKWTIPCKCGARKCAKYLFKSRMTNLSADDSIVDGGSLND